MRGRIKVGRWLPFRARQVLNPHRRFVWAARAAGVIAGSDRYLDGVGAMDWKLAGPVAVAHDAGPDVSRSAAGRGARRRSGFRPLCCLGSESPGRPPTTPMSRRGFRLGTTPVAIDLALDPEGRIRSIVFDRWGDPDRCGTWAWHPFGGEITGYGCFDGLTIPTAGRLGWHFGTNRWTEGEFFKYEITGLRTVRGRDHLGERT